MIDEVDTPALLLDLDKAERNLDRMAALFEGSRVKLRPHAKTHKTPIVAGMQLARGAIGICCAKLGEAEVMADGGVSEILITTELVGRLKIARLVDLARRAVVTIVVDDREAASAISAAALKAGLRIRTLIDIDVGQHRTGTAPGAPALELATYVDGLRGLELAGLQGYEGHLQHVTGTGDRRAANAEAMQLLGATADAFRAAGLSTRIVTTGGTGTGTFAAQHPAVTDVQPGSYVVMDRQYGDIDGIEFENALTLLASVVSVAERTATLDAGYKSLSMDAGFPKPLHLDAEFTFAGDEHGKLTFAQERSVRVGDLVEIVPSHCDTTINLHDEYVVHRSGRIVDRWPIAARGRVR